LHLHGTRNERACEGLNKLKKQAGVKLQSLRLDKNQRHRQIFTNGVSGFTARPTKLSINLGSNEGETKSGFE
jgi:hypothetical protein